MDLGQGKQHQMYSVTLEREVPPGKWRRLHHWYDPQKELS